MRLAARRPLPPGETLPGTQPGQPRKPIVEPPSIYNIYRNFPGFNPQYFYPGATYGRGRGGPEDYAMGGEHYLPPDERQGLSDTSMQIRGLTLGRYSGAGQGYGLGAMPYGDLLRRLAMAGGYPY